MLSKRGVLGATEGIKAQTMLSIAFGAVSILEDYFCLKQTSFCIVDKLNILIK